ncbi:MAG: hypothetical protein ACRC42_03365 [Mycoplasma sp.]
MKKINKLKAMSCFIGLGVISTITIPVVISCSNSGNGENITNNNIVNKSTKGGTLWNLLGGYEGSKFNEFANRLNNAVVNKQNNLEKIGLIFLRNNFSFIADEEKLTLNIEIVYTGAYFNDIKQKEKVKIILDFDDIGETKQSFSLNGGVINWTTGEEPNLEIGNNKEYYETAQLVMEKFNWYVNMIELTVDVPPMISRINTII